MKVLIVEDEMRAASQLQGLLKEVGFEYSLLGILDTVEDAVNWFESQPTPDLVFMDVQLADGISFEIFRATQTEAPIIFTTAFDEYALQAFKVNSIDYLLKPVKKEELKKALAKFERAQPKELAPNPLVLQQLLEKLQQPQKRKGILAREGKSMVQVGIDELLHVYSEESITFGVTAERRFIIEETIEELFQSLSSSDFFQINRGQIVARTAIEKIHPYFNNRLLLEVQNPKGLEFVVSRPRSSEFRKWLNQ